MDLELDGNHVLNCPNCGHQHCRVVKKGEITDIRWDRRNGPTYQISLISINYTSTQIYTVNTNTGTLNTSYFLQDLWMSSGTSIS